MPPIPSASRAKFTQTFQSNDPTGTGFLNGLQAKNILLATGLQPPILAKIWSLADHDADGRLSLDEFAVAMHLCEYSRLGNVLPATLPAELVPQRARSLSAGLVNNLSSDLLAGLTVAQAASAAPPVQDSPPAKPKMMHPATFEDKLKENFERGNAVLEAKRAALKEQEEREKRERDEKDRLEQEKRQKIKDEQERRRQQELERQLEKQRLVDAQREEEHRKLIEQREKARNELIRQQRLEWERQKKQELEHQRFDFYINFKKS